MSASPDPNRSCTNCPSFLQPDASVSKFKKSIGAPICGRYGIPLGKPGLPKVQADKVAKHYAQKCDSYGEPLPAVPKEERLQVTLPDPDALVILADDEPAKQRCSTCAMCKNFVKDEAVAEELGWTTGLCAAKGKLILPNKQIFEAKRCEYRAQGQIRRTTEGLHLLPEYEEAFAMNADPVRAYFKSKGNFIDPSEWETEKEVTDKDRQSGIRAWRRVIDPSGSGNEVFLPCYEPTFFGEDEQAKIPRTGDDEHPELYVDHFGGVFTCAVAWIELDDTPGLWGEAGVGKTELFRHLAWLMCLPFERFSITAQTELDDLAGKMHYAKELGTFYEPGRLVKAWQKPSVICIDEPNVGPPDVWQFLRPLTDNSKQLVLDQNKGERIVRNDDCYLGMAMNPAWDPRNVGAAPIADADASRLLHVFVPLPPSTLEREIIRNRVKVDGWEIEDMQLDTLMAIAEEVRGLSKDGTLPISWGLRSQLKVARASRWFDMVTCYRRAIADFLEPEAQEALLAVVRAHVESVF